ncbi:MAG: hypothetical protein IPF98_08260 [Gemmatimonadetes bacterium]|nr:hypothetical protein [Gemmatimonadota bacterium]
MIRVTNEGEPPSFVDVEEMASSDAAIRRRILATDPRDRVALTAIRYFMREWFGLAPNTRSSISAQLTTLLDPFLVEPYSTFFAGESSVNPVDLLRDGKVLYVYMPVADREAMSRTVCTLIKLEFFREVLRNPSKSRNSFFLCDEFQQFMTTSQGRGDADFFERSRQSRHANIIATQNYPALLKAARAAGAAEEVVENLVGNCALKLSCETPTRKQTSSRRRSSVGRLWRKSRPAACRIALPSEGSRWDVRTTMTRRWGLKSSRGWRPPIAAKGSRTRKPSVCSGPGLRSNARRCDGACIHCEIAR